MSVKEDVLKILFKRISGWDESKGGDIENDLEQLNDECGEVIDLTEELTRKECEKEKKLCDCGILKAECERLEDKLQEYSKMREHIDVDWLKKVQKAKELTRKECEKEKIITDMLTIDKKSYDKGKQETLRKVKEIICDWVPESYTRKRMLEEIKKLEDSND